MGAPRHSGQEELRRGPSENLWADEGALRDDALNTHHCIEELHTHANRGNGGPVICRSGLRCNEALVGVPGRPGHAERDGVRQTTPPQRGTVLMPDIHFMALAWKLSSTRLFLLKAPVASRRQDRSMPRSDQHSHGEDVKSML